jgi:hypothetical protein
MLLSWHYIEKGKGREAALDGLLRIRDEEAVGSNPATPTTKAEVIRGQFRDLATGL